MFNGVAMFLQLKRIEELKRKLLFF